LGEAAKDLTSLVLLQGAIGVELVLEDPFAGDNVGSNRMRGKISSVVGDQKHHILPPWHDARTDR
jgi:hypothetical protein